MGLNKSFNKKSKIDRALSDINQLAELFLQFSQRLFALEARVNKISPETNPLNPPPAAEAQVPEAK